MKITSHILSQQAFWRVSKNLVHKLGLLKAFALTDLIDKYDFYRTTNQLSDGMFFYRREDIEQLWGVKVDTQRAFIKEFVEKGLINYEIRGPLPKKGYYSINADKIIDFINNDPVNVYEQPTQRNENDEAEEFYQKALHQ